jgi:CheY-like chemotaxis protein
VKSIVKSYKGRIYLKSQPGQGSTFTILLPAIEVHREIDEDARTDLYHGSERILIIEDEEALVQVTEKLLSGLGYAVRTSTDSTQALELFQADPYAFDLVLSDMAMPGLAGDILAQRMLALRPDIPIIVMTGYSDRLSRERARQIGIKNLIYKPLSPPDLSKAIRRALETRRVEARYLNEEEKK